MKINRRSFLKKSLVAGSLLAGPGALVSACSGVSRSDMLQRDSGGNSTVSLDEPYRWMRSELPYYTMLRWRPAVIIPSHGS